LVAASFIAQKLPQCGDVDSQIGFLNEGIRPNPLQQLFLAEQVFSALDERDQEIERTAAKPKWFAVTG
jgi:hypothetical protein